MTILRFTSAEDVSIDNVRIAIDAVEDRLIEIRQQLSRIQNETRQQLVLCYDCQEESLLSLIDALKQGWIDFTWDGRVTGWCPGCVAAHEEKERKLNEPKIIPMPAPKAPGVLFDTFPIDE